MAITSEQLNNLEYLDREDLLELVKSLAGAGVTLNFSGKQAARDIYRKVRPRQTRVYKDLCVGPVDVRAWNRLIEGENLQAMVTLYKFRGQVDLILTDPPYNTGKDFRYNDRWDTDPNDPDLGQIVRLEDGSRHTKWMKFMLPRLHVMKAMLRTTGVIAICIDENELFHLGMMCDEVFRGENRLAIINWQKAYAPKSDSKHVSTATEYVLVYAKDKAQARTGLEGRTDDMDARYGNPDNDPEGLWRSGNPTSRDRRARDRYGIQSPFTGAIHYPGTPSWRTPRTKIQAYLEQWGSAYERRDLKDGREKAFVIKGAPTPVIPKGQNLDNAPVVEDELIFDNPVIAEARSRAETVRDSQVWPYVYFLRNGYGRPSVKTYHEKVKKGRVPLTYWADENFSELVEFGSVSWDHEESGHSQTGINELDAVVGKGHGFDTVKPLKLFEKIIHLWCPSNGLVLDPFAGSGTTGHAVLELNELTGANRSFILVEQGAPEKGDKYARSLTYRRLRNALTGERPTSSGRFEAAAEPLTGGFEFHQLIQKVDSNAIMSMAKEDLIDVMITSHWDEDRRGALIRNEDAGYKYLVGQSEQGEGFFLIWNGGPSVGNLDQQTYATIAQEARKKGLKPRYHVYARYQLFHAPSVVFYKIPDKILAHLGLNISSEPFNEPESEPEVNE